MRQGGFTITELMIVVAIIGTLTVAVAPSLARWSTSIRMSSSIREIASELQLARMKAIAQNTKMTVCFYGPSADFPTFTHGFLSLHSASTGWCATPPSSPGMEFNRFKATVRALPTGVSVEPSQSSKSVTVLSRVKRHTSIVQWAYILACWYTGALAPGQHGTASSHGDHCRGSS